MGPRKCRRGPRLLGAFTPQGPHHHDADCDKKEAVAPRGPVTWGLITRHMRVRRKAGEDVPQDSDLRLYLLCVCVRVCWLASGITRSSAPCLAASMCPCPHRL